MRNFLPLLFLIFALGSAQADAPATASAAPVGIIILKAVAGYDAVATWFVSIQWVNRDGGYVIDAAGTRTSFLNDAVGRIIYFDENYYAEVDHNQYWIDWRAGLQSRELVLAPVDTTSLRPEDSGRLGREQTSLEDAIQRYGNGAVVVQPVIDKLKDQIAKLASGLVLQNGSWIPARDAAVDESTVPVVGDAESLVTFTTKDGKRFANARVTVTETGLSVLTPDGGASVAFERLPANIGAFPTTTREKIADWRQKHPPVVAVAPLPPGPAPLPPPTGYWAWIEGTYHYVVKQTYAYFYPPKSEASPELMATDAKPAPSAPASPAAPDLSNTIVLIKGDLAEGTGFLTHTASGPVVITNLHVLAGNPNVKITTASGDEIVPLSLQGATDRDLAMFSIQDNNYKYLELAASVDQSASVGDAAIIPGNSEGGEVTVKTDGALVGIGPQRVEFSNPIFHGNSGGPVLDVKTGKVVAVATFATEMRPTNDLDRDSFANANSAIKGPMRYFGLRLDTVPSWQPYNQNGFVSETLFLKRFHDESRALDSYLNGARANGPSPVGEEGPLDAKFFLTNDKIRKADDDWREATKEGRDNAVQELVWNLGAVGGADVNAVQEASSFYPYDRDRAKYELKYRKALLDEISRIQTQVNNTGVSSSSHSGL